MDASNSCCWPLVCDRILSAESSRNMQRPGCCCLRNGRGSAGVLDRVGAQLMQPAPAGLLPMVASQRRVHATSCCLSVPSAWKTDMIIMRGDVMTASNNTPNMIMAATAASRRTVLSSWRVS